MIETKFVRPEREVVTFCKRIAAVAHVAEDGRSHALHLHSCLMRSAGDEFYVHERDFIGDFQHFVFEFGFFLRLPPLRGRL